MDNAKFQQQNVCIDKQVREETAMCRNYEMTPRITKDSTLLALFISCLWHWLCEVPVSETRNLLNAFCWHRKLRQKIREHFQAFWLADVSERIWSLEHLKHFQRPVETGSDHLTPDLTHAGQAEQQQWVPTKCQNIFVWEPEAHFFYWAVFISERETPMLIQNVADHTTEITLGIAREEIPANSFIKLNLSRFCEWVAACFSLATGVKRWMWFSL